MHEDEQARQKNISMFHDSLDSVAEFWSAYAKPGNVGAPLADIARLFLAGQASSGASEQLWSSASYMREHRRQLQAENLETHILTCWWMTREGFDFNALVAKLMKKLEDI